MKYLRFALPIALGLVAVGTLLAQVVTASPLSGNFVLTISGFELMTPSGSSSLRLDLSGEGLVTADGSGNLTGGLNLTAANPAIPEVPNSAVAAACSGTLAGKVAEPGDGTALIQLQFTPTNAVPAAVGAQSACLPTAITLDCVEIFSGYGYAEPLAASAGPAGSPDPTPSPTPRRKRKHHHRAERAAGGGPDGESEIPVDLPPFFLPSANGLKCVATAVTTSSTAATIDGALLTLDLKQTAPASIVVPTPGPIPTPGACNGSTLIACSGLCVDPTSDPNNCGGCGNVCATGQKCWASTCQGPPACGNAMQTDCNGTCTYTASDNSNCGACGVVCVSDQVCESGACVAGTQCPNGQANCGGACVDLTGDANNCGACAVICGSGLTCQSGVCIPLKPMN